MARQIIHSGEIPLLILDRIASFGKHAIEL